MSAEQQQQDQVLVEWYFDFVSPFSYLQTFRFNALPATAEIVFRPVLFAGLLDHWGSKGPAEVAPKRVFTYRQVLCLARRMGVPLHLPPAHPFNPLKALRLAIALGCERDTIERLFAMIWQEGLLPDDPQGWRAICTALAVGDAEQKTAEPSVKAALRANGERAIEAGVFGVPSFVVDAQVFWGLDATDFLIDWLTDPAVRTDPNVLRAGTLPVTARR